MHRHATPALLLLCLLLCFPVAAGGNPGQRDVRAQRGARTPAQLASEYTATHGRGTDPLPPRLRAIHTAWKVGGDSMARSVARRLGVRGLDDGRLVVLLQLNADHADAARDRLVELGITLLETGERTTQRPARVPIRALPQAASDSDVLSLTLPRTLRSHAVVSEGVAATEATVWQQYSGPAGVPLPRPVRVAVIDGGFQGAEALLGIELPFSVDVTLLCDDVTGDGIGDGTLDSCASTAPTMHGTAVAEIIHDMVPEAELHLFVIDLTLSAVELWNQALLSARDWGADVVSSSLGSIEGNRDGGGLLCSTASTLRRDDVVWATSAGNEGDPCEHEHFDWTPAGEPQEPPFGDFQHFPAKLDPALNEFVVPPGQLHVLDVSWNAWNSQIDDDYDLFYYCDLGGGFQIVASSIASQCGTADATPTEAVAFLNDTPNPLDCAYAIVEYDPGNCPHGDDVQFDTFAMLIDGVTEFPACPTLTGGPYLEESTSAYSINHPADCADVVAAGATDVGTGQHEYFSSQGPTLDGRIKPDLCGPDRTSGASYGPGGFGGTSAAAPHVAGAVALLYQRLGGSFSVDDCRRIAAGRSLDIDGDDSPDNQCGDGKLCLSSTGCQP